MQFIILYTEKWANYQKTFILLIWENCVTKTVKRVSGGDDKSSSSQWGGNYTYSAITKNGKLYFKRKLK